MTREEQLVYCKKCINRRLDPAQGLICNLTGVKATFQVSCADFQRDATIVEMPLDDKAGLDTSVIKQQLSPDIIERLRMDQRLIPGILAGMIVGVFGAILWGVITVSTGFQIGYMALAIGAGVGMAIRKFGNGIDQIFGFWGAGIALFCVLFGNFLSIVGFITHLEGLGYLDVLFMFDYAYLPEVMMETFSIIDLAFYGAALYSGYKFSFRLITEKRLEELRQLKN
ncbi:MAG: hypothetical protein ACFCUU_10940 [Cyclobacteriaceae bacterium]